MAKDKRVEVLFEPKDYRLLEEHAQREGKSVGGVIRDAVARYVTGPTEEERQRAWDDFFAMSEAMVGGPSGSPEEIKAEIIKGIDDYLDKKLGYEAD